MLSPVPPRARTVIALAITPLAWLLSAMVVCVAQSAPLGATSFDHPSAMSRAGAAHGPQTWIAGNAGWITNDLPADLEQDDDDGQEACTWQTSCSSPAHGFRICRLRRLGVALAASPGCPLHPLRAPPQ